MIETKLHYFTVTCITLFHTRPTVWHCTKTKQKFTAWNLARITIMSFWNMFPFPRLWIFRNLFQVVKLRFLFKLTPNLSTYVQLIRPFTFKRLERRHFRFVHDMWGIFMCKNMPTILKFQMFFKGHYKVFWTLIRDSILQLDWVMHMRTLVFWLWKHTKF